ncbi:cytosine permease [Clostridium sp. AM58-1XD]|uniref:cytosine permease n=1 Tax=Clostridium sp. AM58-1XD TaxID=2292307 RepID=UPI001A9A551D|nr:cytosine permease [Clostridium sp. AM58-1XD]
MKEEGLAVNKEKGFGEESLAPQTNRIMGNASYTFAWIAGVININSFMMGAALVPPSGKLNLVQGALAMLIGVTIISIAMTWNGIPGHRLGIPFIVHTRTCFGMKGSLFPGLIRSLPAVLWYGIQSWIGASAINSVLYMVIGFDNMAVCFIGFQTLQILLSILGFKGIKWLENIGAVFIIIALGYMFLVIYNTYKFEIMTNLIDYKGSWGMPFLAGITTFGGTYTTYVISMGDLSRELRKETGTKVMFLLHWIGTVPFTMFMAVIGLMVSGTTGSWDPIKLFTELVPNKPLLIATLLFIAFAQVTTNVLHNVVPSSYVFMEYLNFSYRKSQLP